MSCFDKTLTPPLPQGLTPIPSPRGEGDFRGGESSGVYLYIVNKSTIHECPQFQT